MVQIRRMGPKIGVQVSGVDVRKLDDASFAPIYQSLSGKSFKDYIAF